MANAKNYVKGNGKRINTQYGEIINISLNLEDLQRLKQNKGYVKLTIVDRKEPDQYGNNLSIFENEYEGTKDAEQSAWRQTREEEF